MTTDLKKLQGIWNIVALEVEGQKMPTGDARVVVKGGRFTSLSMGATYEGELVVDTSESPNTFDLKFTAGPEKGNVNRGIFELDGDTWRICLNLTGKDRPKKFATWTGSGLALETLQRARTHRAKSTPASRAKEPDRPFHLEPAPELEGEWAMVSCVSSGQTLDKQFVKMGKRVARGNEITVTMGPQVILKAKFTVDRSPNPMTIDYVLTSRQFQYGIYELEGESLKVNFSAPGEERPADFNSAAGDGRTLTQWRRVKK